MSGEAGDREADPGDRGTGCVELRAHDARICESARVEEVVSAGAGLDAAFVVVVGGAGDAVAGECSQAVDRWVEEPGDSGRLDGAADFWLYADGV